MYGCGLVIFNPPWILKEMLEQETPHVAKLFNGTWFIDWKE
jgi:23S rRNA A2030 N6-methylase RlmJ